MCESYTMYEVGAAVALACIDPRLWHDLTGQIVRQKLGLNEPEEPDK